MADDESVRTSSYIPVYVNMSQTTQPITGGDGEVNTRVCVCVCVFCEYVANDSGHSVTSE